ALETWSEVTRVATGAEWARAEIGRADALLALGETFLAERLLRSLYAGASTGGFRREAYNRLIELYRNDEAPERLVGLHAAELAQNFAPEVFRDFATALMREGQDDMAARLTALLPAGMLGDLKLALFRTGWLDELAERVAFGDFEDRAAWLSLIAAREPADDALSGEADSRTLSASQISSGAEIGSARIWRGAEELIERSAGGVAFQAIAHGGFGQLYQARPDLPVRLAVEGPARLRVSARPVHPGSGDTPIDGWFEISVGGTSIPVPVTSNYGATGIELIGAAGTPGTPIAEIVTVPPGHHHVTIRPETMSLLVGVEIETPALQVPGSVDSLASRYSFGLTPAQRLADLLRTYETSPDDRAEILGRAARLAEGYPLDPDVSSVWRRFARQSGWERIQNVDRSAGLRTVELERYLPESPELQARLALLPSFEEGERLLHTTGETALSVTNPEAATIEASLRLQTAPTLPTKPVIVSYRVGDSEPVEIKLTATDPSKQVGIKLPPGEQVVRFSLAERQANQFVRLRLREEDGRVIGAERERTYEVATPEEPVVLTLQGPVWLQIDEYRDGSTVSRTRFVENGLQTIEVVPDPGQSEGLLRIFRLEPDDEPVAPVPRLAAPVERAPVTRVALLDWPACPAF
ncbi:MAG: hypothetical protein H0T41_08150, partial [Rhodobacteraceae bacterium]|nr:hypothetical protein [Paracoccaceae bacterium]